MNSDIDDLTVRQLRHKCDETCKQLGLEPGMYDEALRRLALQSTK